MERSDSTYMPRLIDAYEPTTDSPKGIPDDGVDTWFLTGHGWYENRHFPYMNLMRDDEIDDGELKCLLWHDKLRDLIGPIFLPMDDLSLICRNRKAQLEEFHKEGLRVTARIDPAPVD